MNWWFDVDVLDLEVPIRNLLSSFFHRGSVVVKYPDFMCFDYSLTCCCVGGLTLLVPFCFVLVLAHDFTPSVFSAFVPIRFGMYKITKIFC